MAYVELPGVNLWYPDTGDNGSPVIGAYCAIGDPDWVAQECTRLQAVGFDGLALNFVDYLAELPYVVQEVLPRLERLRLRHPAC